MIRRLAVDRFSQGDLQEIADRDTDKFPVFLLENEVGKIGPIPFGRICLIRQEITIEDLPSERTQHISGEADPAVFPDIVRIFVKVLFQRGHRPVR